MSLAVSIEGRLAIPVRAVPLVTSWFVDPRQIVAWLSDPPDTGIDGESNKHPCALAAFRMRNGKTAPISWANWRSFEQSLSALSARLHQDEPNHEISKETWKPQSLEVLPDDALIWLDEFEASFRRCDFSENGVPLPKPTIDLDPLVPEPLQIVADDLKALRVMFFEGDYEKVWGDLTPKQRAWIEEQGLHCVAKDTQGGVVAVRFGAEAWAALSAEERIMSVARMHRPEVDALVDRALQRTVTSAVAGGSSWATEARTYLGPSSEATDVRTYGAKAVAFLDNQARLHQKAEPSTAAAIRTAAAAIRKCLPSTPLPDRHAARQLRDGWNGVKIARASRPPSEEAEVSELASREQLFLAEWIKVVGVGLGIHESYEITSSGIRFRTWTDDEIAERLASEQLEMDLENRTPPLAFPCTPKQLVEFVRNAPGVHGFVLPEKFETAVLASCLLVQADLGHHSDHPAAIPQPADSPATNRTSPGPLSTKVLAECFCSVSGLRDLRHRLSELPKWAVEDGALVQRGRRGDKSGSLWDPVQFAINLYRRDPKIGIPPHKLRKDELDNIFEFEALADWKNEWKRRKADLSRKF